MTVQLPNVPLVESPFYERDAHVLSPEARAIGDLLHADGVAVIDFPEDDFATLAEATIEAVAGEDERQTDTPPGRVQDAWRTRPEVRRIACNPTILGWLRELYGRRPVPFQTLNFPRGTEQAAHTDAVHFFSSPERFMCGVWVALEDIGEDSGPLFYYPGSHRLPLMLNEHLGTTPDPTADDTYGMYPTHLALWQELAERAGLQPEPLLMRRGQAAIWVSTVLHGGMPQRDPQATRHSQVTHYFFEECAYYTPLGSLPFLGEIELRDVVDICTGEPVPNRVNGVEVPLRVDRNRHEKQGPPRLRRQWADLANATGAQIAAHVRAVIGRRHDTPS